MVKRKFSGQEAIEFILITTLVFFSALIVVVMFGGKLASFFDQGSSVNSAAKTKVALINSSTPVKYDTEIEAVPDYSNKKVSYAGIEFIEKKDGSLIGELNGEKFIVTKQLQEKFSAAMESLGTNGIEEFISTIKQMAEKFSVPVSDIEVMVGDASKTAVGKQCKKKFFGGKDCKDVSEVIKGKANINNVIVLKYQNNILIKQKDQQCTSLCSFQGKFQLEGVLDASNKFVSNITGDFTGTYQSNITLTDNQLTFNSGSYNLNASNGKGPSGGGTLWWGDKSTDVYPNGKLQMTFPRNQYSFLFEDKTKTATAEPENNPEQEIKPENANTQTNPANEEAIEKTN